MKELSAHSRARISEKKLLFDVMRRTNKLVRSKDSMALHEIKRLEKEIKRVRRDLCLQQ